MRIAGTEINLAFKAFEVYVSGCCSPHCKGCHNPQSWDFNAGEWMEVDDLLAKIKADSMSNVSFSGGDPFYQVEAFTELARRIKQETDKTIWCWTGFTLEEIQADPSLAQMLPWLDVLVDGPFILEQRDTELLFRGSPNQRIIYLHEKPEDDYIPGTVPLEPLR